MSRTNWNFFSSALLAALLTLGSSGCDTANNVEPIDRNYFVRYFGNDGNQSGVDMEVHADGTVLLLGNSSRLTSQGVINRIYLVKVDGSGKILWEKFLGRENDVARDLEPSEDGNFVVLADQFIDDSDTDCKLIKIDGNGQKLDSVVFVDSFEQVGKSVSRIKDGYIVAGRTDFLDLIADPTDPSQNFSDFVQYRCDFQLQPVAGWKDQFGGNSTQIPARVFDGPGNTDFYLFGSATEVNTNKITIYNIRLDEVGESGGAAAFGDPNEEVILNEVFRFGTSGGFLGVATRTTAAEKTLRLVRFTTPFTVAPDFVSYSRDVESAFPMQAVSGVRSTFQLESGDENMLIVGNEERTAGFNNIWVSKRGPGGEKLWESSFGSIQGNDLAAQVKELPDGRILVLGTMTLASRESKMVLLKLNPDGKLSN